MGIFGKITNVVSNVGETIVDTAGNIYGGTKEAFSDRMPTPKAIGGPITDLGLGVVSTGLGLGQKIKADIGAQTEAFKETTAKTIVGGLDPVFGEGSPLDISAQASAGDYRGALTQLPSLGLQYTGEKLVEPITQAGQALTLPLLAVAGILLLK
jgi:hypothetical protein